VLPVVDKLLNIPVVQFNVPFIVSPNDVILPETSNLTDGVFPIPILPDESIKRELIPLLYNFIVFGDDIHKEFVSIPNEYGYVVEVPGFKINLSPVPPKFPTDGMATLVLPVVDKPLKIQRIVFRIKAIHY
jgi:hypothetical protein